MEFKHLEVFVKLVENLSFSAAAEELNISQPTVSLHIKQLEEELDTAAFGSYRPIYQSKSKGVEARRFYYPNGIYTSLYIESVQKRPPQYPCSS